MLLVVSCGGSVPKAELIAQGDAICAQLNEQTEAIEQPATDDAAAVASYFEEVGRVTSAAVDEIKEIGAPDEDAETYDAMLANFDEGLTKLDETVTAIRAEDQETAGTALQAAFGAIEEANGHAAEFGFTDCAE